MPMHMKYDCKSFTLVCLWLLHEQSWFVVVWEARQQVAVYKLQRRPQVVWSHFASLVGVLSARLEGNDNSFSVNIYTNIFYILVWSWCCATDILHWFAQPQLTQNALVYLDTGWICVWLEVEKRLEELSSESVSLSHILSAAFLASGSPGWQRIQKPILSGI